MDQTELEAALHDCGAKNTHQTHAAGMLQRTSREGEIVQGEPAVAVGAAQRAPGWLQQMPRANLQLRVADRQAFGGCERAFHIECCVIGGCVNAKNAQRDIIRSTVQRCRRSRLSERS
ncbi:hypothetical protein [Paraburkholderia phenazinium]|uniref:hypothetical protein n=1 Tax=Paraburkholderia phenazinium TaxID=60549 RepID=UPI001C40991D|nr:hypothetical protein [Paraburkholderia phenazinium]